MESQSVLENRSHLPRIDLDGRRWSMDLAGFELSLSKIGNSIYVRIPSKIAEKLRLKPGQRVWMSVLTSGPIPAVSLFLYLGTFKLVDKVRGIKLEITPPEMADEVVRNVSNRLQPTSLYVEKRDDYSLCVMEFGHLAGNVLLRRPAHILSSAKFLTRREAQRRGARVRVIDEYEEEVEWTPMDISVIKTGEALSPEVNLRWEG